MRLTVLTLSLAATMAAFAAPSVLKPEAGKYYKIKHISGLYLTDSTFNGRVAEDKGDNSQVVEFIPVEGQENVYNIVRVRRGLFYGSDRNWNSVIISRNVPMSQFEIRPSEVAEGYVIISNVGLSGIKNKAVYLGTDDYTKDTKVYTDKDGKNAERHQWTIEECEKYDETSLEPQDVYPDNNISDDDPRAGVYPGYKLVFAEEFSGEGKPDSEIWNFETGFKRNNEHQYYDGDNNTYIQDGVLVIEARDILDEKRSNPKYNKHSSNSWPANIGKYLHWTSGSMQTKGGWDNGYTWLFGIYEVRAKVPQMVGCWPAIWSTGMQYEWPYGGEIDIMEYYGHSIHGNVCWGNGNRWAGHWNSATVHDNDLGEGWGDEYHIWRMFWDYDHMELWCDDWLVNNIDLDTTNNDIPEDNYDHGNGCNPFRDVRQMLWLNLALGGDNGGSLTNTLFPNRFLVDYARVYQKIGTDGKATYHVDPEVSEPTFSLKDGVTSGIEETFTEPADAEETYYNLQGLKIANPAPGQIVIRKKGSKTEKLFIR